MKQKVHWQLRLSKNKYTTENTQGLQNLNGYFSKDEQPFIMKCKQTNRLFFIFTALKKTYETNSIFISFLEI